MLAWAAQALIDLVLTEETCISWVAVTCEGICAIYAVSMMAWGGLAVIHVCLTVASSKTWWAVTAIAGNSVMA